MQQEKTILQERSIQHKLESPEQLMARKLPDTPNDLSKKHLEKILPCKDA